MIDWGWSVNATENGGVWSSTSSKSGPTEHQDDDSFPLWEYLFDL